MISSQRFIMMNPLERPMCNHAPPPRVQEPSVAMLHECGKLKGSAAGAGTGNTRKAGRSMGVLLGPGGFRLVGRAAWMGCGARQARVPTNSMSLLRSGCGGKPWCSRKRGGHEIGAGWIAGDGINGFVLRHTNAGRIVMDRDGDAPTSHGELRR